MKRNFSLIVLAFEIAAIVVLHAVKMNQVQQPQDLSSANVSKAKISTPVIRNYPLLSIK
jgi:hypothetical protein